MDAESVIDIAMAGIAVAAKLAAPVLITALVVGLAMGLLQSITQVQEVTLAFVPKAAAVAVALIVCGHWMITEIITFTNEMFSRIPQLLTG